MSTYTYMVAKHRLKVVLPDTIVANHIIPSFSPFASEEEGKLLFTMNVRVGVEKIEESLTEIGQFDCGGANHGVYQTTDGGYVFEIYLPGEGSPLACVMRANPDFSACEAMLAEGELVQQNFGLNNALMMAYAFAAAEHDTLLIHASVIRNGGYGYLFTAPSGTGKSTHTHLWYVNIPGCDLMNDDNPIVRIIDDEAIVFGSPWSGKTPCYRNISAPIGAITRIEQRPENSVRKMTTIEAFAALLPAVSSMKWDQRVYRGVCSSISHLLRLRPVFWLGCRPDAEAAHVCYDAIHVDTAADK